MNRFAKFCWGVLVYNVAVVLWGAYVRATGSGAGCGSHWPTCNGEIIPRPQSVEMLIEFTHRATSGIALLAVLTMFIWAFRAYPRRHIVRLGASLSLLFITTEALVGAGLVLFEWVAHNTSVARAVSMAVHLVNTFLLLGALTLTAWWASGGEAIRLRGQGAVLRWLGAGMLSVLVLGMTGAVIALGDTLFLGLGVTPQESPLVRTLVAIRPIHPIVAVLVGIYLSVMGFRLLDLRPQPLTARLVIALMLLYVVQMLAGSINVVLKAPVWMQIVHLLLSDLIWVVLVLLAAVSLSVARQEQTIPSPSSVPSPSHP
ncbi:MAG: COX15/CtaA family protein [Chthonomonadetes bacterium]|nr:COX15/CtaA family protein [Chthonomonadetes bacterium]